MPCPCSLHPCRGATAGRRARWRRGCSRNATGSSAAIGATGTSHAPVHGACSMSSKTVCARSPAPRTDRDPNGAMTEPSTARLEWFLGIALVLLAAQVGLGAWCAVWLFACVPATLGHQIYYALGRRFGEPLLDRLPARMQPAIARARTLVRENAVRVMLVMRFAYGIRLPLPILCGAVGITPLRFLRYNALTALVWALLFTWLGYVYGAAAGAALARVAHYEAWFLVGAVA